MLQFTCPQCARVVTVARREDLPSRPFCSGRCQRVDLGKWFNGEYVISDPLPPDFTPQDFPPEEFHLPNPAPRQRPSRSEDDLDSADDASAGED